MTFWKWSRTAATNATADSSINYAEGMAPSGLNDSGRAVMAAASKYRDDTAGAILTGGTSTAYTATSYQGFTSKALMDGAEISFTVHATNGAAPTLNVDGLGADTIIIDSTGPTVVPTGTLIAGGVYTAVYYNSGNTWRLKDFYQLPFTVPIGGMIDYFGTAAPSSNFVFPYGQAISRTTYAALFALTGTTYGTGDGSTTFNVPDIRGRVVAGKDDMGGSAVNRLTSTTMSPNSVTLGAVNGGITGQSVTLGSGNIPSLTSSGSNSITVSSSLSSYASGFTSGSVLTNNGGSWFGAGALTQMTIGAVSSSGSNAISVSYTNASPTAVPVVQPTIIANKLIRII